MIKGVVKGRSLTIIGTDGDVFTSGSVGLKIKVTFDDEWNGLVKQAVFQNGSNAYISTAINDEFEVPLEVLSIPGRMLRIGIRGTNGNTLVIPTIYAECLIHEGSDKNGAAGQDWSPSEVDQVLSAVAAIDNKVGDLDDLLTTAKDSVVGAINEVFGRPIPTGVSDDLKEALLQLAQKVAYIDEHGQNYYDDLYYALYPGNLISITATYDTTHKALVGDTLDSLKPYLTVIAFYDNNTSREVTNYTLSGSLSNAGNNTISVYFIDRLISATASFVVSTVSVSSISAVFTQGSAVIYDTDSLDVLRQYLTVTATYSDSTSEEVNAYALNGSLTEGTSIITVAYGGQTDTISVIVSISLDSIAYGALTYRQMFITNNEIIMGDFEGATISSTEQTLSNGGMVKIQAGSPILNTEYYNSPTHSLKCFGSSSMQVRYRHDNKAFSAGNYICCVAVKVDRYSTGHCGMQVSLPTTNVTESINLTSDGVTDEFVGVTGFITLPANRTGIRAYIGTYLSANADCYVDDAVFAPAPSGITAEELQTLYETYLELRRG